jgi:Protein of unknown function (DUF3168)
MPSAAWSLQQSIYATIATDPGVIALVGSPRIHDDVPQNTPYPYLTLGQSTTRDWSTATEPGEEHILTLHVWSREAGHKQAQEIVDALRVALHDRTMTLAGHRLINLRHVFSDARREADGETYHGILRLRAVTEPL